MELPKYITIQIKDINSRLNKKPYKGAFKHKNKIYYCGTFETIRQAQVSVDKKRIYLGLEPLVLKKQNN